MIPRPCLRCLIAWCRYRRRARRAIREARRAITFGTITCRVWLRSCPHGPLPASWRYFISATLIASAVVMGLILGRMR